MHICLVTREFPPAFNGGISTHYRHLAQILAEAGHRVTVLTDGDSAESNEFGARVVRLGVPIRRRSSELQIVLGPDSRSAVESAAFGLGARDWLLTNGASAGIDLVESPEFRGASAFLVGECLPPLVVTCHGSVGQVHTHTTGGTQRPGGEFLSALEVIAMSTADVVVCYGRANQADWAQYLGRAVRYVLPPFLPTALSSDAPDGGGSRLRGIAVGRLNNWKGVLEAVAALAACREGGLDLELRWIGRDVPAPLDGIPSMAKHLRNVYPALWGNSFLWHEALDPGRIRAAQATADFALVPSRWDTFNFTAVEAMSVGTALIISSGAGASDFCRDGVNALVVPPRDVEALTAAVQRMADPDLRKRLGCAGRETVEDELSPRRIVASRLAVFEEAIARHRDRGVLRQVPSLMDPFTRQWRRALEMSGNDGALGRLPTRMLLSEVIQRAAQRLSWRRTQRRR